MASMTICYQLERINLLDFGIIKIIRSFQILMLGLLYTPFHLAIFIP